MNGEGISGNDGVDPIETTWIDIINAANSPIKAGIDLKKSGNVISVNTNGTVANSANNDFVIGSSCWVSGYSNFGGGKETKTKGHQNFTFGISSLVYDGSGTMALGQTNSALQENYSLVGGQNSVVETYSGTWSETINKVTESDKRPSFAFGYGVSAKGGAVVFGNKNFGMGENSAYQGKAYTSKTVVGSSIASIFENNLTAGMSWFSKSPSGGDGGPFVVGSFNWGYNPGTFVAGISSVALPPASFVACKGNIALSYAQSVIGKYNYPEQSLFTIGGGFGDDNRKNVLSITNDGKFYIGRSIFGNNTNSSHWVNDYPEFYVGNTLKLYGTLSAAGSLLAYGDISAGVGSIYAPNIFTSGTLTSNYFVTTDGVVSNKLTATNILTSSISSLLSATTSIPLVLSYTSVNADASMSANCAGITASYSNPGGSWNGNASWYNIVNNVNWITNNTSGNSAKSALTSKSALSAGSAAQSYSSFWTSGSSNTYRPVAFADANCESSWSANKDFKCESVYDNTFKYNPNTHVLSSKNVRAESANVNTGWFDYIISKPKVILSGNNFGDYGTSVINKKHLMQVPTFWGDTNYALGAGPDKYIDSGSCEFYMIANAAQTAHLNLSSHLINYPGQRFTFHACGTSDTSKYKRVIISGLNRNVSAHFAGLTSRSIASGTSNIINLCIGCANDASTATGEQGGSNITFSSKSFNADFYIIPSSTIYVLLGNFY